MEWNRLELSGRAARKTTLERLIADGLGNVDDKVLLKEIGYILVKKIGHGSFSKVWKAKSTLNVQKELAIKIIKRSKASPEFLDKFLPRELAIIQTIQHPNLLKYYEITDGPTSVYIVMQFAENGTLAELIERKKFFDEEMSKMFFTQLIDVVEFLHRKGIVHRDIKCENLLLDKYFKLKLSDFGFARSEVLPDNNGKISKSRTYCGSYAYASPEILANNPYNPFMADVWCMGMVLYNMLVGTIPYKQTDIKQLIANSIKEIVLGCMILQAKKHPPKYPMEPKVSELSRGFIKRMLVLEVERSTIPQLRKDPWWKSEVENPPSRRVSDLGASTSTTIDEQVNEAVQATTPPDSPKVGAFYFATVIALNLLGYLLFFEDER